MNITKNARWTPATLTESDLPDNAIPFVMTKNDRDTAMLARLDIIAMKAHREPEGLTVTDATMEEFLAAREAFRHGL